MNSATSINISAHNDNVEWCGWLGNVAKISYLCATQLTARVIKPKLLSSILNCPLEFSSLKMSFFQSVWSWSCCLCYVLHYYQCWWLLSTILDRTSTFYFKAKAEMSTLLGKYGDLFPPHCVFTPLPQWRSSETSYHSSTLNCLGPCWIEGPYLCSICRMNYWAVSDGLCQALMLWKD
jgi:hypothetical protein